MSLNLLDTRPIKSLNTKEKRDLPVSIALHPDGNPLMVSCYKDVIWDFYLYIPQLNVPLCEKRIDWHIALPDGRFLTDPEHFELLEMSKDFIWSLFTEPVDGRERPSMLMLKSKIPVLIPLLRWMVQIGIYRFSDLAGHTLDYVPIAKLKEGGKGKVGDYTHCLRLAILEDLYHQRDKLLNALYVHPWPHETAFALSGREDTGDERQLRTAVIPDAVAVCLAMATTDYVQNKSARILGTLESIAAFNKEKFLEGYAKPSVMAMATAKVRKAGFASSRELAAQMIHLRTACFIVIALFSGGRISEMMSLAEHCITHGKSKDGTVDVLWLHGIIYKTGVRPKKWLVPPIVEQAIETLTRLTAPLRLKLRE